jgi:hypothetical protein
VSICRYVTEGSFDAYMWQTLETKARFIQQVMSGDVTVREAEDLEGGALNYAEIKAIASGNPMVMEKVQNRHRSPQARYAAFRPYQPAARNPYAGAGLACSD